MSLVGLDGQPLGDDSAANLKAPVAPTVEQLSGAFAHLGNSMITMQATLVDFQKGLETMASAIAELRGVVGYLSLPWYKRAWFKIARIAFLLVALVRYAPAAFRAMLRALRQPRPAK